MKFNKNPLKTLIYPLLGIFLTVFALPAQGMFRAAFNQSRTFKSSPAPLYKRFSQSQLIAPTFAKQERKYEHSRQKPKFEYSRAFSSKNSWWSWAAISAGLAAWGLYSTAEAEEEKQDEIEREFNQLIDTIKNSNQMEIGQILSFCAKKPQSHYLDKIILAIIDSRFSIVFMYKLINFFSEPAYSSLFEAMVRNLPEFFHKNRISLLYQAINYAKERESGKEVIKKINQYVQNNLLTILSKKESSGLIAALISNVNTEESGWAMCFQKHLSDILKTEEGINLIKELLALKDKYYQYNEMLIPLLSNYPELPASLTYYLLKNSSCDFRVTQQIMGQDYNSVENYINLLSLMQLCNKGYEKLDRKSLSATQKHLFDNRHILEVNEELGLIRSRLFEFIGNPEFRELTEIVIAKEKELEKQGFYTLVHGQRKAVYFPAQVYTLLWELSDKKEIKDYIFPWIKKPITTSVNDKALWENIESKIRSEHLKNYHPGPHVDPLNTLFLNYALSANMSFPGESTAWYIQGNTNQRSYNLEIKTIFELFGYKSLYERYGTEIDSLADEYAQLSASGNLLLFAIPKNKINEVAYHSYAFGKHVKDSSCSQRLERLLKEETFTERKVNEIPDPTMFCMPMTFDEALNPKSGIKIFPIITGDQAKIQKLKEKEQQLFEKIRKEMRGK